MTYLHPILLGLAFLCLALATAGVTSAVNLVALGLTLFVLDHLLRSF